ncbi:MAG: MvdC family ATP-grasp ribosomal peptide maturase [Moorea sp. SIO3C2]|nr:MvdC family ATP-grasp ribosomal peptide maturase [Moorena sp. SIO3C2]
MNRSRDIILLITHSGDYFTIDRVAEALSKRGAKPFRFDTDQFPTKVQLAAGISSEGLSYHLDYSGQSITTEDVQGVWMRRLWHPQVSPNLAPQFQDACVRESLATIDGFLDNLNHARWVDRLERIREAENKPRQLRIANEVGLLVPRTLVTNNPDRMRGFFAEVEGKMVAKLLTPLSYSMEASSFFLYTSVVKEEDLQEAEMLRYSPMVFQEEIPKQRELRITFVAGNLFVGALDASRYSATTMDWRSAKPDDCAWEPDQLPSEVAHGLNALMARLGLTYGAIDMIVTPDGEYVFLEVNPTGEWGMLERDLGYPISDAIANALLSDVVN